MEKISDAELQARKQEWATSGRRHDNEMRLAWDYRRAGYTLEQAKNDWVPFYASVSVPEKAKEHENEVDEALHKAYDKAIFVPEQKKKNPYVTEQQAWRSKLTAVPSLKTKILAQEVMEPRLHSRQVLKELYRNAHGRVWIGKSLGDCGWADIDDGFMAVAGRSDIRYITLATFGDAVDPDQNEEFESGKIDKIPYKRTNDNVDSVVLMLMEFDAPIGKEIDDFDGLPEAEQKQVKDAILTDTCAVLEKAGLEPTAVTFSGHKSYHVLFRLTEPITAEAFQEKKGIMRCAYERIGADPATVTASRCTRYPRGSTAQSCQEGTAGQHLMYLNAEAEVDFETFVDKLTALADKISEPKAVSKVEVPMVTVTGKRGEKEVFSPVKWDKFIRSLRITKAYVDNRPNEQFLIQSTEQGIYNQLPSVRIGDILVRRAKEIDYKKGCWFCEERRSVLSNLNMNAFLGNDRPLKLLKDSIFQVYAPFKNGLLEIRPDMIVFHENSYRGHDIPADTPTLVRNFSISLDKSEFETFLERACGSMESHPEWMARKHSFETLLGYLICRKKEAVNYLCTLTEETPTENMGGTGKSLIMKAVRYWRKRFFKDMKRVASTELRFMWSGIEPSRPPEYFQLDDIRPNFNFEILFNATTDDLEIEKKGKDIVTIPYEDVGKFVLGTNFFPKGTGNSFERRLRIFELSNHYDKKTTPNGEFGHLLFDGWDDEEWRRFDNYMVKCVQEYQNAYKASQHASDISADGRIISGLVQCESTNMEEKKLQANLNQEALLPWIEADIVPMINCKQFVSDFHAKYITFYQQYNQTKAQPYRSDDRYLRDKVKEYCDVKGLHWVGGKVTTHNGKSERPITIMDETTYSMYVINQKKDEAQKQQFQQSVTPTVQTVPQTPSEATTDDDNEFLRSAPDYNATAQETPKKTVVETNIATPKREYIDNAPF